MKSNVYVSQLSNNLQEEIVEAVFEYALENQLFISDWELIEFVENSKNSRLCDLSEIIDISKFL